MPSKYSHGTCKHCGVCRGIQSRGLCRYCHNMPSIRDRYPMTICTTPGKEPVDPHRLPEQPAKVIQGSEEKLRILEQRYEQGYSLFHPEDGVYDAEDAR